MIILRYIPFLFEFTYVGFAFILMVVFTLLFFLIRR